VLLILFHWFLTLAGALSESPNTNVLSYIAIIFIIKGTAST
jgi:hypothetical protein